MNDVRRGVAAAYRVATLFVVGLGLVWGGTVLAHERSISYSTWNISARHAHVMVRLSELDASAVAWSVSDGHEHAVGAYLTERLRLIAGDVACTVRNGPRALDVIAGRAAYEWDVDCPPTGPVRLESTLLLDVIPSHLHFARVNVDGAPFCERVLSDSERTWLLLGTVSNGAPAAATSLLEYVALGVQHIGTGYDHIAFLLALLLMAGSFSEIAIVVTGFTVAHSMTLALAVLGYVRPERTPIEALIGLSIALVAAENVWLVGGRRPVMPWGVGALLAGLAIFAGQGHGRVPALTLAGLAMFSLCYFGLVERVRRPAPLRWAIAFVFGLVHGFGFAAVLVEANVPAQRLIHALFGFNLGVELGQLAVVMIIWPVFYLMVRLGHDRLRWMIVELGSAAVFGLGVFWFVSRAYG